MRYAKSLPSVMQPTSWIAASLRDSQSGSHDAVSGVRVNPAVGVSKSIGLFFLYYLLMNLANSLAANQVMDAMLAAWLPNLGMTGIALWLFARLR